MKSRGVLILIAVGLALIPLFFLYQWLQKVIRPRRSAGRFFLFIFANFLLIVVYTILVVGVAVRLFGQ